MNYINTFIRLVICILQIGQYNISEDFLIPQFSHKHKCLHGINNTHLLADRQIQQS